MVTASKVKPPDVPQQIKELQTQVKGLQRWKMDKEEKERRKNINVLVSTLANQAAIAK